MFLHGDWLCLGLGSQTQVGRETKDLVLLGGLKEDSPEEVI